MFSHILFMVSAVVTMAILSTKYFFLEAFTVKFETFRPFTITAKFLFILTFHFIVLFVDRWQKACIWTLTSFRERGWWVSDCILYWETLINSFFEWFAKRFRIEWILCFIDLSISLRVFSGTLVLHLWGDKTLIRAGTVKNFSEIVFLE